MSVDKAVVHQWIDENLGYVPNFIKYVNDLRTLRVIKSFMACVMVQEGDEWGRERQIRDRCALMWVYGKETYSHEICKLATGSGKGLVEEVEMEQLWKGEGQWSNIVKSETELLEGSLRSHQRIAEQLAEQLVHETERGMIMELITMMGW